MLSTVNSIDMLPYLPPQANLFNPGGYLTGPSAGAPITIAENYLRSHAAQLGMLASDMDHYLVTTNYVTQTTGATTLTFNQSFQGLGVEHANFNITVAANGSLLNVGGGFISGLSQREQQPPPTPAISDLQSIMIVADSLGITGHPIPSVVETGPSGVNTYSAPTISHDNITPHLQYVAVPGNDVRLTWNLTVRTLDAARWYNVDVDAINGQQLAAINYTDGATYEVFAVPTRSPDDGARTIETNPDIITPTPAPVPSPFGWHDTNGVAGPESTITSGNNVNAYTDRDGNDQPDTNSQPDGGAALNFTGALVSLDLTQAPSTYSAAAVVNLFYLNNFLHDVHYLYGFDEAARNFQVNTYGRGGVGNDAVNAEAQDGSGLNNANFGTPPDGTSPTMQMFEWNVTTPNRDGDFDTEIVIHEYGHGVSNRLTGNGAGLFALQSGGMGEGWSDWWALMLTQKTADETTTGRGLVNYSIGQPVSGPGIRQFKYDFDITNQNAETFLSYGTGPGQDVEEHFSGALWCAALWDITKLFIDRYGFEANVYDSTSTAGNIRAMHLIMNALKVQPLNPSFIAARDAILAADTLLYGGADLLEIWTAFARRGLGEFASTSSSNSTSISTSFDVPILASVSLGPNITALEGDTGTVNFVFTVTFTGLIGDSVSVVCETVDGTATALSDYASRTVTMTFLPDGPTTQAFTVQVISDSVVENDETFSVRLRNPVGTELGRALATGTIVNDDVALSINDVVVVESDSGTTNAVFTVSVEGRSPQPASVLYFASDGTANAGTDFVPVGNVLSLPAFATRAFITVPIIGDRRNEGNEEFFVNLISPVNIKISDGVGSGTIIDTDPLPALYVNDVQVTPTPDGLAAVFSVGLDAASGRNVSVNFTTLDGTATAFNDYTPRGGVLTFAPGVNTVHVTVPVPPSAVAAPSPNERFFLSLSDPNGASLADTVGAATLVFTQPPATEFIIDDGDPGYRHSFAGWTNVTNLVAYKLDYEHHPAGNGSGTATWSVTDLPIGNYQIFTKWVAFSNRATNAPYAILDEATPLATVLVNQQAAPASDQSNGVTWHSLGTFQITSGTLTVRLSDNANGYVIADALRIVPDGIPAQTPEIDVSVSGRSITIGDATPALEEGTHFGPVLATTDSTIKTFTIANTGNAPLHITDFRIEGDVQDFVIVAPPASTVAAGRSTTFQILFHPTIDLARTANIVITSDDADEPTYSFAIGGMGTLEPIAIPFVQNAALPADVNADGGITALDAVLVIRRLLVPKPTVAKAPAAATGTASLVAPAAVPATQYYLDVNGDGKLSALDAILVIRHLLTPKPSSVAAHSAMPAAAVMTPVSAPAAASPPAIPNPGPSVVAPSVQAFAVDQAIGQITSGSAVSPPPPAPRSSSSDASPERTAASTPTLLTPVNVRATFASDTAMDADDFAETIRR